VKSKIESTKPRRADEEDEEEEPVTGIKPFKMKSVPLASAWKVHIDQEFTDVRQFQELVEILELARPGDTVEIKLTTPGGRVGAVLPLLTAIATTNAKVYVHAVSDVASAGTFILMMADDVYINPYTTIMFHQVTYGAWGIGNHVEDRVQHVSKSSKQLLKDLYENFLEEAELERLFQGKEFWMDKAEFDARYIRRAEIQAAEATKAAAAAGKKKKRSGVRRKPVPVVEE
jgi:ATP-dependent protease ClpP protease subunit